MDDHRRLIANKLPCTLTNMMSLEESIGSVLSMTSGHFTINQVVNSQELLLQSLIYIASISETEKLFSHFDSISIIISNVKGKV